MKVLMLGWELPPFNSGGLGTACLQLCKALARQDVDIEFILPYKAEHDIDFMAVTAANPQNARDFWRAGNPYDSRLYRAWAGGHSSDIYEQQESFSQAAARLAKTREFDIVHAHDWLTFRAALRIKEQRNCPIILHVHSVESDRAGNNAGNPLVREIEETAMHIADKIVVVSDRTRQAIQRDYDVPGGKIQVIHNSINKDDLAPLDASNSYHYLSLMKSLGYKVVVSVGRLTIQKGLPNLLLAAKEVVAHAPKTLFLIVGSGEQYEELVELATGLGIGPNVLFADFQRGKRWRDAFTIGDLFVMPSVSEPFGLTPLEAIGYGTPVLISKQSGVSEVLNNCLKVDFWDVREMANQITTVVQNGPLGQELLKNVRPEYERLSWQETGQKVAEIYRQHAKASA